MSAALKTIEEQYEEKGQIEGRLVMSLLFDFIKRKMTFRSLLVKLIHRNQDCKLT